MARFRRTRRLCPASGEMACGSNPGTVFILERAPIVAGSDFRSADPGTNSNTGQRTVNFTLTDEAGDKFWDYTSANVGKDMAVVMGDQCAAMPSSRARFAIRG